MNRSSTHRRRSIPTLACAKKQRGESWWRSAASQQRASAPRSPLRFERERYPSLDPERLIQLLRLRNLSNRMPSKLLRNFAYPFSMIHEEVSLDNGFSVSDLSASLKPPLSLRAASAPEPGALSIVLRAEIHTPTAPSYRSLHLLTCTAMRIAAPQTRANTQVNQHN
ncbi:hypothetical protein FQR65_LT20855 [Abscondita terminalis]|nr:hypothetical protein FQR65_LT20855 [Abscondita terminalis]